MGEEVGPLGLGREDSFWKGQTLGGVSFGEASEVCCEEGPRGHGPGLDPYSEKQCSLP